eukprot:Em0019g1197a
MLGYSHMVNIVVAATNATISVSTGDHWHGTLVQVAATELPSLQRAGCRCYLCHNSVGCMVRGIPYPSGLEQTVAE